MVDPITGIVPLQNTNPGNKASASNEKRETSSVQKSEDSVELSHEAQVLSSLPGIRHQVANSDQPLGLSADFIGRE